MIKKYKEYIKEKVVSSLKDDIKYYIYYTGGLNLEEIKSVYQVFFDAGYYIGNNNDVENLHELEYECVFLLAYKEEKILLHSNDMINNNSEEISDLLDGYGYCGNIYFFKDFDDLLRLSTPVRISDYNKPQELVYESLMDILQGPSEEEMYNNIKDKPEKLFDMGVDLDKIEWIKRSIKIEKEQGNKTGFFFSIRDIADIVKKYNLSDDEKIELLLDINNPDFMLSVSVLLGFIKGINIALENGADINKRSGFNFINPIRNNNLDVLKILIETGKINSVFYDNLLNIAKDSGNKEIIDYLLDIDKGGALKESFRYTYLYDRIMILIDDYQDYVKVLNYITSEFKIYIVNNYNMHDRNFSHVLLDVDVLYNIINSPLQNQNYDDDEIFRFYTAHPIYGEALINYICGNSENTYVNRNDILNINELYAIKNLLMSGKKNGFKEIYKSKTLVYESLLDHLKGPSDEDIKNNKNLEIAVDKGNIKGVKRLINKGANIHILKDYPLRHFSYLGNLEMVKYLVEHGATVDAFNGEAIIVASNGGHFDVVKYLVDNGADIHTQNEQVLTYAIQEQHLEIVKYLISVGCGEKSYMHKFFLRDARKTGNNELIKYIENVFFKQVKESLLDKLDGPNMEEVLNNLKDKPIRLFNLSIQNDYEIGINYALEHGVNDLINKIEEKINELEKVNYMSITRWYEDSTMMLKYDTQTEKLEMTVEFIKSFTKHTELYDIIGLVVYLFRKKFNLSIKKSSVY